MNVATVIIKADKTHLWGLFHILSYIFEFLKNE